MKNLFSTLIIALGFQLLFAQSEHPFAARIELGSAFVGTGDILGSSFNAEVGKYFTKKLRATVGFNHQDFFNDDGYGLLTKADASSIELTGYFDAIRFYGFSLEAGAGGFVRNWKWTYATGPNTSFLSDGLRLEPSSYGSYQKRTVGYTWSLGIQYKFSKSFGLSARATFQDDTNRDSILAYKGGLAIFF